MNRRIRQRRTRRLLLGLLGTAAVTLLVLLISGLLLPPRVVFQQRVVVPHTPETVWTVLTDLDGMPSWRRDLLKVERLPERLGRVRWRETRINGTRSLERIEFVPPERMVIRMAGSADSSVRWVYRIRPAPVGAEFVATEERIVHGLVLRVLARISGLGRADLETLCHDLATRLARGRPEGSDEERTIAAAEPDR